MNKLLKFVITGALVASPSLIPCGSSINTVADSAVFYIDNVNGKRNNPGTREAPYDSIKTALDNNQTKTDLELHLLGNGKYETETSSTTNRFADKFNSVSIIGEIGDDNIYPRFTLSGGSAFIGTNLTLDKIEFVNGTSSSTQYWLFACGNDLTFGSDCKVDNTTFPEPDAGETGIEYGRNFQIFAGSNGLNGQSETEQDKNGIPTAGPQLPTPLEGNSNTLTFLSGDFGKILLSNRVCDTGSLTNHYKPKVVVGGTAYVSYLGGGNDWFNYIDGDIVVQDEARVHRIVGGVLGYKFAGTSSKAKNKVYIYHGKTTIDINGGYVKNIIGGSMGRGSAYVKQEGDTTINVTNGYVECLIGGSAAGNTYGDISINISGGTFGKISNDIKFGVLNKFDNTHGEESKTDDEKNGDIGVFCGGAGVSSMIDIKSDNGLFPVGGIGHYEEIDILDTTKTQKVIAMGNTYGEINANITGGTFNCNIHGGGKGFDYANSPESGISDAHKYEMFNIAQVSKGVNLTVSGCTVNGNIYGGGAGIEPKDSNYGKEYRRIAMVAGTVNLTVGNTSPVTEPGTQASDYPTVVHGTIYGGGIHPTVTSLGASDPVVVLNIINTWVNNPYGDIAVHGGSENADVEGNIYIDIKGSAIQGNVYLGSGSGSIEGDIKIDVLDSTINGNMILGSGEGNINGDVTVLVEGISIINNINIGSDKGTITGKVDITISSTNVGQDINIGTNGDHFEDDIEVTINKGTEVGGTVNDNTGDANLDLNISEDTIIEGEMLYVQSFIRAHGNYGDTATLTAVHTNKPKDVETHYQWYKVVGSEEQIVEGETDDSITLTSSEQGSYYCVATHGSSKPVKSNVARFVEKSDVKGAQVRFNSTPIFVFYVEVSSDFTANSEATFQISTRQINSKGVENNDLGYRTYKFSVALASYEMASDIRIVIESEGVDAKYSVRQYCKEVLDSQSTPQALKDVIIAFLNYGAAAQNYFDYSKYILANSYLDEESKIINTTSIGEEYNKLVVENNSDDIKAYSATIEILTSTTIRVYFSLKAGGSIEGYEPYINGEKVSSDRLLYKDGRYYVEINNVSVQNLNTAYTVKLAKGDSYASVTYSVLTYCYSKQNSENTDLKNFVLALFDYYQAVQTYNESIQGGN